MMMYCQDCQKTVYAQDVQTVRLPNLRYVHSGICPTCGARILKTVHDKDILVDATGRHYPAMVYKGPKTPDSFIKTGIGQMVADIDIGEVERPEPVEEVRTLKSIKIQGGTYEKEIFR